MFVIYLLSIVCRIIPDGSSRGSVTTTGHGANHGPDVGHGSVTTAKHVHLHKRRKHKSRRSHSRRHTGGSPGNGPESPAHDVMLKDMVKNTGAPDEGGLTERELDLAHSGSHGDTNAINKLKEDGVLSPDLADSLINKQAQLESGGEDYSNTPAEIAKALNETPHSSAPLMYTPMRVVKKGEDPQLERDLDIQKTMKSLRSALPSSSPDTDSLLNTAEDILRSAPQGNVDAPYIDKNGNPTGKSYSETAEDFIEGFGMGRPNFGGRMNPTKIAEQEYKSMVDNGMPPEQARTIANSIEEHEFDDMNKHMRMKDAFRRDMEEASQERAMSAMKNDIQTQKVADNATDRAKLDQEIATQFSAPKLHPINISEEEIGLLKGIGDVVPPKKIVEYVEDAYENAVASGLPQSVARAQAERAGALVTDFNSMLRGGESVETALSHVKDKADRLNGVDQRRDLLQNGSVEIAQLVAQKTELLQQALQKVAKDPDCKDKVFDELTQEMKKVDAQHAQFLHELQNKVRIREPKKLAEEIIDQTNEDQAALLDVAYKNPIVTKDILQKGINNVEMAAEKLNSHLEAVNYQEQKHNPPSVSALKLLDDAKRQDKLKKIAKKNAEEEQKAYERMIKDQQDMQVMETEEKLAAANKAKKIIEEGRRAAEGVLKSGGTVDDATAVKAFTENAAAKAFENKEASLRNEIMKKMGGPSRNPEMARRMAAHIAIAHSGDNAVGKTPEEVMKKEQEIQKREILKNALFNDLSTEKFEINSVIPEKADEINIDKSVVKFPLKTFIDEEATNIGEEYVKNKKQAINDEVRNKFTKKRIDSGLNVIETEDGFLNLGENSQKITIEDGVAFFTPAAKLKMEKKGINTDYFVPKHNQGERKDLARGETYYEAAVKNMDLSLPSPYNKTPDTLLSNGKNVIDVEEASAIVINKGKLHQIPWKDYSDMIKPKLNPYPNEAEKIEEAEKMTDQLEAEKRKEALDSIKVNTITNPDGEKHIVVVPPYGISEMFEETEGMKRLSHIDPSKNVAVSETPTEDRQEPVINPLANVPSHKMVEEFIEEIFNEASRSGKVNRFVDSNNAFTGRPDPRKQTLVEEKTIDYEQYLKNDNKPTSSVKNAMIKNTKALSQSMNVSEEEFIELVNKVPDSAIAMMMAYNEQSETTRAELVDAPFFKMLQPLGNDVSVYNFISQIFTQIAKVTGKPNTATSKTLEKQVVPNLKAVKTEQVMNRPSGNPSVVTQETAPKKGTTVLSKQVTKGLPRVPTGTDSSFPVQDPNQAPTKEQTQRNKVNPKNPYTNSDKTFKAPANESPVVRNGTTRSPFNVNGRPLSGAATNPVRVTPKTTFSPPPAPQASNSSLKGPSPTKDGNVAKTAVAAGSPGINPRPTSGSSPAPNQAPRSAAPLASPATASPSPRLGIPSSPQK
ncbi:Polar tube protein 3 [Nosema granulosis]|uniref:Polar tube protein 3 n=1 Tax=Nosema granulosis TaxID=83296 RepID=A0A9P6L0E4_9MICR|nr:Polar tube protein 3 [Nosema granulosis]